MRQDMPTGPGILYEKQEDGTFDWQSLLVKKQGWSMEAVEWINYKQSQPPFNADGVVIRHSMNGGERRFELYDPVTKKNVVTCPDGYVEIDNVRYFLQYDGCYWHKCQYSCKTSLASEQARCDVERDSACRNAGELIKMSGCEWMELRKKVRFDNRTSAFFNRKSIMESELWDSIDNGRLFGVIKCDITATPQARQKFIDLNFPPIFSHIAVEEKMLESKMIEGVNNHKNLKFPLAKQLTLVFNHTAYVMTTEMARFYKENGFLLTNLAMVIEYERDRPLKNFVNTVTQSRIAATKRGDKPAGEMYKLVANR